MPKLDPTIEGGAEIRYDFEIRRLWKLITEADQIISAIVYEGCDDMIVEPYDRNVAERWLERASLVSPALKRIVFPSCSHPTTKLVENDAGTSKQRLCLDCGQILD